MSLNVSNSRFVRVYDPTIDLKYSDKVVKARIVTSRKTGRKAVDEETGEIQHTKDGKERDERKYSEFQAQFVGAAFEGAKALHGQTIDIIQGWIVNDPYIDRNGKPQSQVTVFISDFALSDFNDGEGDDLQNEGCNPY